MVTDPLIQPPDPLLESVLQTSLDGIMLCQAVRDQEGKIIDFQVVKCNDRVTQITGITREKMVCDSMLKLDPDGFQNGIFNTYRQVVETGLPVHIEHYYADANVWMAQSIARYEDGVLVSVADISALKEAELANRKQAELLRSVLDSSSNAIIAFKAVRDTQANQITDFQYVAHNEVNRRNMNLTDEEIIGHTLLEFFPDMVGEGLFDQFTQVVKTGESTQFEVEFNKGGWAGWFEIGARKWNDGIVLTLANTTERKLHQQQVEKANIALRNANDNLRQFAHIASHDLQEPLRKIVAFGDMLNEQFATQLGATGQDIINRMQSSTGRMSTLIRDVLAYSRVNTQRRAFQPVPVDQLLTEINHELMVEFKEAQARLETDKLPTVMGDLAQLRQLFEHLLLNALKFRPQNRPVFVRVTCRTVSGTDGPAGLDKARLYHEISVADNGIGFDDKYAGQIFQVFQRLHPRQDYEGTGVGLAICKRIIENHAGAITATAQLGEGATFRLYLPC